MGAIAFTRDFPLKQKHMVGKQITAEQLIEERKVMTISKAMFMNIGNTYVRSRLTPACIYYYYYTHQPLSNMHLVY